MTDQISTLLDQIVRLDQEATKAPWITYGGSDSEYGEYTNICNIFHNGDTPDIDLVAHVYDDKSSAEFIALSREVMPALAQAVRGVLDVLDAHPAPRKEADPTGYATTRLELFEHRVREAITEALGDTDALGADDA